MESLAILLMASAVIFLGLAIAGIISDWLFSHVKFLERYIEKLPLMKEDSDD